MKRTSGAKLCFPERAARALYVCVAAVCLFYGLLPIVTYGITHAGVGAVLLAGFALMGAGLFLPRLKELPGRFYIPLHTAFFVLFAAALTAYAAFVVSYRVYCRENAPPAGGVPQTVIVLGGGIEGDRPRLVLARRLEMAAEYLGQNREARCVVTGGQGWDEEYPEAYVMKKYLTQDLGVDADRIEMEDASADTRENIANAASIIAEKGMSASVTVVTDGFHQLRAAYFCTQNGLSSHALSSRTPWGLLPAYEVREMGAWVKAWLLDSF